jgi:hypothetical protein
MAGFPKIVINQLGPPAKQSGRNKNMGRERNENQYKQLIPDLARDQLFKIFIHQF